eukprot:TRINITY_DN64800_c0_g1_i1.p1 TRINITY_DN64800_c0_g1~~TRINITY_DN64800_c0_g1_i1.p1  ORF type:complete len:502 (+),score=-16.46 TRINITY_DN64800_c0_g1_i1:59-1564(+)
MFAALSILALASTSSATDLTTPYMNVQKHIHKHLKDAAARTATKISSKSRSLGESVKEVVETNSTDIRRELRYRKHVARGGFIKAELFNNGMCDHTHYMEAAVPIKKEIGCVATNDNGYKSMMFTGCHYGPNNEIMFDYDYYNTPACNGYSYGSGSEQFEMDGVVIHEGTCSNEDRHFSGLKFYCENNGNPFFAKGGLMNKEFDKSWECESNTDPAFFGFINNGGCLPRSHFGDSGIDHQIKSISMHCNDNHLHYEGFDGDDCTGMVHQTHDEHVRPGCDRYEWRKCTQPGYLVRSDSNYDDLVTVNLTPLDQCYKTSVGSAIATNLEKHDFGYMYKIYKYNTPNSMCDGFPDDWEMVEVPFEGWSTPDNGASTSYHQRHWHAHDYKEAINLDLYKVSGNKAWNDWYTIETYHNDMCEGEPAKITAGKQFCSGGCTGYCDEHKLTRVKYYEPECMTPDPSVNSEVFMKGECKSIGDGMFQKASCYFRGQEYMKPEMNNEHH